MMKPSKIKGIFIENNKFYTINPEVCKGIKIYNERIVNKNGIQYRSWNPYRSKLSAAMHKGVIFDINESSNVLYLGAATGTTVSHISDIIQKGTIFAVENSALAMKKLLNVSEKRKNIIPILSDANHPDRYNHVVSQVDILYQDISQRNQSEIFIKNIKRYLKTDGTGIMMVKARSIDVSLKPKKAFDLVCNHLKKNKLNIKNIVELQPYEKDHAVIICSY